MAFGSSFLFGGTRGTQHVATDAKGFRHADTVKILIAGFDGSASMVTENAGYVSMFN
jgi:hypothetical protein